MTSTPFPPDFEAVLDFHGHRCLDVAMGYRVAKAALRELDGHYERPQDLVATVGNDTCAVDAIQRLTGCTLGKRNLVPRLTGKPVYVWQDPKTGDGVRIYVHYWEDFDTDGTFRAAMGEWKGGGLSPGEAAAFEADHERRIRHILTAPEAELFRLTRIASPPPPKSGGFTSRPCASCGEHVKASLLGGDGRCSECGGYRSGG